VLIDGEAVVASAPDEDTLFEWFEENGPRPESLVLFVRRREEPTA
jgi:hypothetical protein